MIVYNGRTGGLGRHFEKSLAEAGLRGIAQLSRLEDQMGFRTELDRLTLKDKHVTLVQMAALVSVPECEKKPEHALKTNVTDALLNVSTFYTWAKEKKVLPRVFYVSTGHVYGDSADGKPIVETMKPSPRSVYAKTKRNAEEKLLAFQEGHPDLQLLIGRVFGLVGPDQPDHYVLPSMIRRARTHDLSAVPGFSLIRDYLDARDVCRIISEICGMNWEGESFPGDHILNICSGRAVSVGEMFRAVLEAAGYPASVEKELVAAPGRENDVRFMVGDTRRLVRLLKREPQTLSLEKTIADAIA
jgi:nucleoside-diphosphate-sugar epimerase